MFKELLLQTCTNSPDSPGNPLNGDGVLSTATRSVLRDLDEKEVVVTGVGPSGSEPRPGSTA